MAKEYPEHWAVYTEDKQYQNWLSWFRYDCEREMSHVGEKLGYLLVPTEYPPANEVASQAAKNWYNGIWKRNNGKNFVADDKQKKVARNDKL